MALFSECMPWCARKSLGTDGYHPRRPHPRLWRKYLRNHPSSRSRGIGWFLRSCTSRVRATIYSYGSPCISGQGFVLRLF